MSAFQRLRQWVFFGTLALAAIFVIGSAFLFNPEQDQQAAWVAYREGDLDQAMRLARRALWFGEDGTQVGSLELMVQAARKRAKHDLAKAYLIRMTTAVPAASWPRLTMADILWQEEDFSAALSKLEEGLALSTGNEHKLAPIFARRGQILVRLGRLEEARQEWKRARHGQPNHPETLALASRLFEAEGNYLQALEAHEQAMVLLRNQNAYFHLTPEGRKWTERLVYLRMRAGVGRERPLLPGM